MSESSNGGTLPEPQTFGRLAGRLRSLGYDPTSALAPDGVPWRDVRGLTHFLRPSGFVISEHAVALRCFETSSPLVLLAVAPIADVALSERVLTVLERFTSGPCRTSSDGVRVWPLRPRDPPLITRKALDGAVVIEHATPLGFGAGWQSTALLPLDGTWSGGSPLTVPRAELPAISGGEVEQIVAALEGLPVRMAEEHRREQPRPARRAGWIGR